MKIYNKWWKRGLFWMAILLLLCSMVIAGATVAETVSPETEEASPFDTQVETIEGENATCYVYTTESDVAMSCLPEEDIRNRNS